MTTPTPHINAKVGDFAKTVLMPGDPLRSKYIAQNYLKNPILVNDVSSVQGYTGEYEGVKVSVMASGMGIPSIGIYSYELFNIYGVENIIRVGSAGAMQKDINLKDIVVGIGACTNSNYADQFKLPGTLCPIASYDLIKKTDQVVNKLGLQNKTHFGCIMSTDNFYMDSVNALEWSKMGILAQEMEASALYANAMRSGKNALSICTISDSMVIHGLEISNEEKEKTFDEMIKIALEVAKMCG